MRFLAYVHEDGKRPEYLILEAEDLQKAKTRVERISPFGSVRDVFESPKQLCIEDRLTLLEARVEALEKDSHNHYDPDD